MLKTAVVVMTRVPEAGKTKTRMMPRLTGEECVELHIACLQDICRMLGKLDITPCICFTGAEADFFRQPLFRGIRVVAQKGSDLGERMFNITKELLMVHNRVVLLGSDTPQISADLMERAISSLDLQDVVLGPATDGGYYLLGLKSPVRELFANIAWGSERVLVQTRGVIQRLKLKAEFLEWQNDLDTWEDLKGFYLEAQEKPALQELTVWQLLKVLKKVKKGVSLTT